MERFSNTFEALLQSLSDAVKQLGEGNQQQQTRVRVEEAKQDFISCCDVICFQVKQAMDVIKTEAGQPSANTVTEAEAEAMQHLVESSQAFTGRLQAAPYGR